MSLVKLAHLQSYPFDGIGRASKMSRETIAGLVQALELFIERDDNAYYSGLEEKTRALSAWLDEIPGITSGVLQEPTVVGGLISPSYAYIELAATREYPSKGCTRPSSKGTPRSGPSTNPTSSPRRRKTGSP